jgi:cytochrome c oxidase assembly protein subunit 15
VRLTDAGLGCPDWPGCYGSLVVEDSATARAQAKAEFPDRPLESGKAWREMIHRYIAASLGLAIVLIAALACVNRKQPGQPVAVPLILLGLVIFQGLLGMWTVTLLLKPVIVMAHLLGGLATTGLLFWLLIDSWRRTNQTSPGTESSLHRLALIGLVVLWPDEIDFAEGFILWRGLGVDYEGGILDAPSRVAIHFTHRLGALVTALFLLGIALTTWRFTSSRVTRNACLAVALLLVVQVGLGISVVWFGLPIVLAAAHNGVAALLLLAVINLNHATIRPLN